MTEAWRQVKTVKTILSVNNLPKFIDAKAFHPLCLLQWLQLCFYPHSAANVVYILLTQYEWDYFWYDCDGNITHTRSALCHLIQSVTADICFTLITFHSECNEDELRHMKNERCVNQQSLSVSQ